MWREAKRDSQGGHGLCHAGPACGAVEPPHSNTHKGMHPGPRCGIWHPVGRPTSGAHEPCAELSVSKEGLLALICTAQGWQPEDSPELQRARW